MIGCHGGSPGLVIMGWDSCLKVVGSNPGTIYLMDILTYICCKNCNDVCLKRLKINNKRGQGLSI